MSNGFSSGDVFVLWYVVAGLASWMPLIVPILFSVRRRGLFSRKVVYVLGTYAASWALPVVVFLAASILARRLLPIGNAAEHVA